MSSWLLHNTREREKKKFPRHLWFGLKSKTEAFPVAAVLSRYNLYRALKQLAGQMVEGKNYPRIRSAVKAVAMEQRYKRVV